MAMLVPGLICRRGAPRKPGNLGRPEAPGKPKWQHVADYVSRRMELVGTLCNPFISSLRAPHVAQASATRLSECRGGKASGVIVLSLRTFRRRYLNESVAARDGGRVRILERPG